jgi:hypothetical protein
VRDETEPYLARRATIDFIEEIASKRSLVVYAGSGVSIDKTGLNWTALVTTMMHNQLGESDAVEYFERLSPLEAASVVKQSYIKEFGEDDVNKRLVAELRRVLYPGQLLRRAQLPDAIVRLVAELHDQNRDVHVVTTNYDDFLERHLAWLDTPGQNSGNPILEPVALDFSEDLISRTAMNKAVASYTDCDPGKRRLLHLHGYVPEDAGTPATFVTFSEVDYARAYRLSAEVLGNLLRTHSMLIIGSGLTDPPLISALASTAADARKTGLTRLAVVPLQGLQSSLSTNGRIAEVCRNIDSRMDHFEVEVTFPDFYSQTAELITEIRIAAREQRDGRNYRGTDAEHHERLVTWWRTWHARRHLDWETANDDDHKTLRTELDGLQQTFKLKEPMKLEIWIRWEPDRDPRLLKLWASSTGTWLREETMPVAEISNESKYVSVASFCHGRPSIYTRPDDRWRTYLAVPVRIGTRENRDVPVAVITLASMDPETQISRRYTSTMSNIVEAMVAMGTRMVSGGPAGSR